MEKKLLWINVFILLTFIANLRQSVSFFDFILTVLGIALSVGLTLYVTVKKLPKINLILPVCVIVGFGAIVGFRYESGTIAEFVPEGAETVEEIFIHTSYTPFEPPASMRWFPSDESPTLSHDDEGSKIVTGGSSEEFLESIKGIQTKSYFSPDSVRQDIWLRIEFTNDTELNISTWGDGVANIYNSYTNAENLENEYLLFDDILQYLPSDVAELLYAVEYYYPITEDHFQDEQTLLIELAHAFNNIGVTLDNPPTEQQKGSLFLLLTSNTGLYDVSEYEKADGSYQYPLSYIEEVIFRHLDTNTLEPTVAFGDRYDPETKTLTQEMLGGYGGAKKSLLIDYAPADLSEEGVNDMTVRIGNYVEGEIDGVPRNILKEIYSVTFRLIYEDDDDILDNFKILNTALEIVDESEQDE